MSLALPVSIISAPAPTVTMTATGTPIAAACNARRRRDADAARRGTDQGPRAAAASLTDPCQARNSSSGSLSGAPADPAGAGRAVGSGRAEGPSGCGLGCLRVERDRRAQRHPPAPAGQACPGNPPAGYSFQAGPGRCGRAAGRGRAGPGSRRSAPHGVIPRQASPIGSGRWSRDRPGLAQREGARTAGRRPSRRSRARRPARPARRLPGVAGRAVEPGIGRAVAGRTTFGGLARLGRRRATGSAAGVEPGAAWSQTRELAVSGGRPGSVRRVESAAGGSKAAGSGISSSGRVGQALEPRPSVGCDGLGVGAREPGAAWARDVGRGLEGGGSRHRGTSRRRGRRPPVRGRCAPRSPRTPATPPGRAANWSAEPGRARPATAAGGAAITGAAARSAQRLGRTDDRNVARIRSETSTARGRGRGRPRLAAGSDASRRDHRHPRPAPGRLIRAGWLHTGPKRGGRFPVGRQEPARRAFRARPGPLGPGAGFSGFRRY